MDGARLTWTKSMMLYSTLLNLTSHNWGQFSTETMSKVLWRQPVKSTPLNTKISFMMYLSRISRSMAFSVTAKSSSRNIVFICFWGGVTRTETDLSKLLIPSWCGIKITWTLDFNVTEGLQGSTRHRGCWSLGDPPTSIPHQRGKQVAEMIIWTTHSLLYLV